MSDREFSLPDLGEGLTEAEVVRWLVEVGDHVKVDQPLLEVVTAKATVELPSPFEGRVTVIHFEAGAIVQVGQGLVSLEALGPASQLPSPAEPRVEPPGVPSGSSVFPAGVTVRDNGATIERAPRPSRAERRGSVGVPPVISPVVRRLAQDLRVDLSKLEGTGPGGVVRRADVEAAAQKPGMRERIPLVGLHRQMADAVARSRREIPEATLWIQADAGRLLQARESWRAVAVDSPKVSIAALVIRFCVLGLKRWPALNARVQADAVELNSSLNIGFAVQANRGLMVPVVANADQLALGELDAEVRRLSSAARAGSLVPRELIGGTFTVNNYGVFGVDGAATIINYPQVAMLGIGRVTDRAWVVEGRLAVRPVTELTLAFDHRVCDGGTAAAFLRFVVDCVEEPLRAL